MNSLISILMLEDSKEDAELINTFLIKRSELKFVSTIVDTQSEYETALDRERYDIILCDHSLYKFNSIAALKMARKKYPFIAFILLTGGISEDDAIILAEQGIDEYIMKDNLKRLPSAILKAIENQKIQAKMNTQ